MKTAKKEKKPKLPKREREAIAEFKRRVQAVFPEAEFLLYGSFARGDQRKYSDIDLLVILDREVNTAIEDQIYGLAYDVDEVYGHDLLLAPLVETKRFWESDLARAMPLRWNVDREGIKI